MKVDAAALQDLQTHLDSLRSEHLPALVGFTMRKGPGFVRTLEDRDRTKMSEISTATAVISICHAQDWDRWLEVLKSEDGVDPEEWSSKSLQERLLDEDAWSSSTLRLAPDSMEPKLLTPDSTGPKRNPYHTAFTTEAAIALESSGAKCPRDLLNDAARYLKDELMRETTGAKNQPPSKPGGISIQYPPSAHLTQLAVRVLRCIDKAANGGHTDAVEDTCRDWALNRMARQMALAKAGSRTGDPYEIAYAAMIVASFGLSELTPDETRLVSAAIDAVFACQSDDGLWPRSHPLFAHSYIGTAYSYEYEMLSQLLQVAELKEHLLRHVDGLALAAKALETNRYGAMGTRTWSSGHIPEQRSPESWATASVYQFAHDLSRLVAEATRRELFAVVGLEYQKGGPPAPPVLLDAPLDGGKDDSLLKTLDDYVIRPLKSASEGVEKGRALPQEIPVSIVLYGPPGTGKTTLARLIASRVGWPLVTIDPSHVVGRGLDRVQESANAILGLVSRAEAVVVLLDEFDELMRDRAENELVSRFLTTAMLPKLATINASRRVVLIVATNHLDLFDPAITRPGRFDSLIQVLAPSVDEKLRHWPNLGRHINFVGDGLSRVNAILDEYGPKGEGEFDCFSFILRNLTYAEFGRLAQEYAFRDKQDVKVLVGAVMRHWEGSSAYQYLNEKAEQDEDDLDEGIVKRDGKRAAALERLTGEARLPFVPGDLPLAEH